MRLLFLAGGFAMAASLGTVAIAKPSSRTAHRPASAAPHPAPAARYSTWATPIGVLLEDPAARAAVDAQLPQFSAGPMVKMAQALTFRAVQGYAPAVFTADRLAALDVALAKLTPRPLPAWAANLRTPNFEESRVPPYRLPDPLVMANGRRVTTAAAWWNQRRPEILKLYESQVYGRAPGRPAEQRFEVFDAGTPALDGKAIRKQVTIHLSNKPGAPTIRLVQYLPASARGPVPVLLMLSFGSPVKDPTARPFGAPRNGNAFPAGAAEQMQAGSGRAAGRDDMPVSRFLDAGIGVAAINYTDVDPDFDGGYATGIRGLLDGGTKADRKPDAWGALAARAWSLSRVQDYFETDRSVDAKRVAIWGASRTGKAALWAAATDQRFAAVLSCCSGEAGAALLRRNFGKNFAVGKPSDNSFWTAPNFAQYFGNADRLPVDAHMLIALIAPRPVLLQTGSQDLAGDPKGEFLAQQAAKPVYRLLGARDFGPAQWPPRGPILGDLGYFMHEGGHGVVAEDWNVYLQFLVRHLKPGQTTR
jgi:hypothetical protein